MRKALLPLWALVLALSLPAAAIEAPRAPAIVDVSVVPATPQLPDAALTPAAPPSVAALPQGRLPELSAISNVIVDVRGARGGNGDVAASYLTVTDMIARKSLASRAPTFRFLMDEDAQEILAKMLG